MEIRINGKTADITADTEKTVGEILAGLEQLLASSGHRLSGLAIDGQNADLNTMEEAFSRNIDTVINLDIFTSSLPELVAESLLQIRFDIEEYENMNFGEKAAFFENWKKSPQALLAAEQMPDLFMMCEKTFSGSGIDSRMLHAITEERLREIKDPSAELANLEAVVSETCARLIDLPLDIQTGKDGRAAQTIQIFSGIAEKIFRIIRLLKTQRLPEEVQPAAEIIEASEKPVADLIGEFNTAVRELLDAYERQDMVLAGDLAEYEVAPRLQELYAAVMRGSCEPAMAGRG